ncbi:putative methyltransferase-domain-containing protein [Nemania sp. FL0916]|nr:putative methyltransferase-domain-containing protein [Nemania sp. FL0916]
MTISYRDVSPHDFPQVWQRPSFGELLTCLKQLHIEPPIWNAAALRGGALLEDQETTARSRRDVIAYLASIVSNSLQWIEDDDQKEAIWEEASRCLSQRCGRAGMGAMTRKWPFPNNDDPFELVVREPPITGDSLGHKTWGSSFLMAQLLDSLKSGPLAHLLSSDRQEIPTVLELGSGTGLLGIAAAAIWQVGVVLSDLPDIMPNLDYNIEQNRSTVEQLGGGLSSGALVWGAQDNATRFSHEDRFSIILAADGIYDDEHPALLSSAIHTQLLDNPESRAIIMVPIRDHITRRLIAEFQARMSEGTLSLATLEEHVLTGQDDWGDDTNQSNLVECWWAIFGTLRLRASRLPTTIV